MNDGLELVFQFVRQERDLALAFLMSHSPLSDAPCGPACGRIREARDSQRPSATSAFPVQAQRQRVCRHHFVSTVPRHYSAALRRIFPIGNLGCFHIARRGSTADRRQFPSAGEWTASRGRFRIVVRIMRTPTCSGANWVRPGSRTASGVSWLVSRPRKKPTKQQLPRVTSSWLPRDRQPRLRAFAEEARLLVTNFGSFRVTAEYARD